MELEDREVVAPPQLLSFRYKDRAERGSASDGCSMSSRRTVVSRRLAFTRPTMASTVARKSSMGQDKSSSL